MVVTEDNIIEMRNYSMVAGFMAVFMTSTCNFVALTLGDEAMAILEAHMLEVYGLSALVLIIAGIALAFLHKRDMTSMAFIMLAMQYLMWATTNNIITLGPTCIMCIILSVVFMITKDEQRFVNASISLLSGLYILSNLTHESSVVSANIDLVLIAITLYSSFAIMVDRWDPPLRKYLTVDNKVPEDDGVPIHYREAGAALGFILIAIVMLSYMAYFAGVYGSLEDCHDLEIIAGVMMIMISPVMMVAGKMRFTPFLFMMAGMATVLSGLIGVLSVMVGVFFVLIGILAFIHRNPRKLIGIIMIVRGIPILVSNTIGTFPTFNLVMFTIVFLISTYLIFALYSNGRLRLV